MYLWMLGAPQRGCLFIVAARYYGGAILEIHLAISSPLHILHYRWPFCLFFSTATISVTSCRICCALRYDRSYFDSLSGHWDYCYESREIHGDFFFFSFERTVVENSADLKIITKLERSSRSRDRLSSLTNLHDSKRPINFRSKKFTR